MILPGLIENFSILELINYFSIAKKIHQQKVVAVPQLYGGGSPTLWYIPLKTTTFLRDFRVYFFWFEKI